MSQPGVQLPQTTTDSPASAPLHPMHRVAENHHPNGHITARMNDDAQPIVTLRNVSKKYTLVGHETVTALKDISLAPDAAFPAIHKGEFVMIRGPSGGGKTTLLNMIGTIDSPSSGTIEVMGSVVDERSEDNYLADLRLRHIGFVFQTFNLIATMSACENVELPMTLLGELSEKEIRRRAKQLLGLVGLRNRVAHLPSELSGGEQQRVSIARALANNPDVLLLDEPTGDLDTQTTVEVMDLLLKINQTAGTTMIMVTHNPDVECYADRILYVEDGRFTLEARNTEQSRLDYTTYSTILNSVS
jgi:putative ABC transport system ATP-binding protein